MTAQARKPHGKNIAGIKRGKASASDPQREQAMAVLQQFRFVFKSAKKHFQWVERETGVSGSQLWAMAQIAGTPGVSVSELARALAIHQSTASNLIDKLVQRDLARRERKSDDQRIVRLYLTRQGQTIVAKAPQPVEGVLPDALMRLPKTDLLKLDALLKGLAQLMRVRDASGRHTPLADI